MCFHPARSDLSEVSVFYQDSQQLSIRRKAYVSSLFRNVPSLISLEVSPFCFWFLSLIVVFLVFTFGSVLWFLSLFFYLVVGLARSGALRSPQGGALRAKRRARPTTAASRPGARLTLPSLSLVAVPPSATGGQTEAPTSASLGAVPEQIRGGQGR